ncbi:MAG TPA: hypothetical protein EYN06_06605 [Myxococcales bacterium]|nr:hypothetical protein [Myxococcales bacterium]
MLAILYENQKSGVLEGMIENGMVRIHMKGGNVIDVKLQDGSNWKLGDFLLESGTVAENEMEKMVRRADKKELALEKVLINHGIISESLLGRFIELHVKESLLPLLLQSGIEGRFIEGESQGNPYIQPIAVPYFIKTAAARQKLWPAIRERIPQSEMVFARVQGYEDLALANVLEPSKNVDDEESFGLNNPNERLMYYFVNSKKTVRQLAYATCLGEFETAAALCRLMDRGYIHVVAEKGRGEKLRRKRVFIPLLFRTIAYAMTATVLGALIVEQPGALKDPAALLAHSPPQLTRLTKKRHIGRIENALKNYLLTRGEYPKTLDELVAGNFLTQEELKLGGKDLGTNYTRYNATPRLYTLGLED